MIVIDCVVCSVFEREQGDLLSLSFSIWNDSPGVERCVPLREAGSRWMAKGLLDQVAACFFAPLNLYFLAREKDNKGGFLC